MDNCNQIIRYRDEDIVVCLKPSGVLSTEEPGQMTDLIRKSLGKEKQEVFVIHRLDKEVSGLMVYALSKRGAVSLNQQIEEKTLEKRYLAVINGCPEEKSGRYDDLLIRIRSENKTYVADRMRKGVRDASLTYGVLCERDGKSLVKITLITGRTHQIRAQFSSRQMPLLGDRKYGSAEKLQKIALFSCELDFKHPVTGKKMKFSEEPPEEYPWSLFEYFPGFNDTKL